jgi:phospholipid/cholesterol/gamma-HCH transport system permease protein
VNQPAAQRFPRLTLVSRRALEQWNGLGVQTAFHAKTLAFIWSAITQYKVETIRLIAQMSLGVGALAVIGGTVVIVSLLTLSTGSLVAIQGFHSLSDVGVQALSGFFSAYANTRITSPLMADVGLAATIGAGATAQLGAMRINEEIDALEVMGIRAICYLASTRVVAGVLVVIPLFGMAALAGFVATKVFVVMAYGQSTGVYDHYFHTYLQPSDLFWSFLQATGAAMAIMLVHTYYGFTATGGPAGVGDAVGRSVRTSLILAMFVTLAIAMAVYGVSGDFHLSG